MKLLYLWFFLLTATFSLIFTFPRITHRPVQSRHADRAKLSKLQTVPSFRYAFSKTQSDFQVEIVKITPSEISPGEPFTLQVRVSASHPYHLLTGEWGIPSNMEIVSGPAHLSFSDLNPGQVEMAEITLKTQISDNQQIHFHVYDDSGPEKFGNVAQFNTQLQSSLKDIEAKGSQAFTRLGLIQ